MSGPAKSEPGWRAGFGANTETTKGRGRGNHSRRPPYARTLAERAAPGRSWWILIGADVWAVGNAWAEQQHRVFTLCPPGEDPAAFDWSAYRHAPPPVALARCGAVDGDQLRALAEALLAAGSPRLYDLIANVVYQHARAAA